MKVFLRSNETLIYCLLWLEKAVFNQGFYRSAGNINNYFIVGNYVIDICTNIY